MALGSSSGMGLLLSLVIFGNFLVKISIFNVKVGFFLKKVGCFICEIIILKYLRAWFLQSLDS